MAISVRMEPESCLVVHNEGGSRFEVAFGGQTAFAEYYLDGDRMIFTHTEVPKRFRGRGIAKQLVLAGFETATKRNLKIVPLCSYVARVLGEHPEFRESGEAADQLDSSLEFKARHRERRQVDDN